MLWICLASHQKIIILRVEHFFVLSAINGYLKVIYHLYIWIIMSLFGVIGYHVTLREGHMIANHPYKDIIIHTI